MGVPIRVVGGGVCGVVGFMMVCVLWNFRGMWLYYVGMDLA